MTINRVGVIGGGQLAAMMQPAAAKLGIELIVQTPREDDPGVLQAAQFILANVDDAIATAKLANCCDLITFENEFINLEDLQLLANQGVCFRPSINSLAPLLDKYEQRCYLQSIGLPIPEFRSLNSREELISVNKFPVVLKARRHGYDGQGTFIVKNATELEKTWENLQSFPMLLEGYINFTKELAVMAARNSLGEIAIYNVVETQQENQVCRRVYISAVVSDEIILQVENIARTLLEKLDFIGILGIELFLTDDHKVLVNEIAPRTHNSGHYTIDACETSQFEMQLRAIADLPLGNPRLQSPGALMVNLLGYEHSHQDYAAKRRQIAAIPQTTVHWYGKTESRPGRKLGHVTTLLQDGQDLSDLAMIAQKIESIWYSTEK